MKITVAINTYNAAKHLEVVLESIKLVDEILICDMYSTDATIEIAKKYNARIISHEKVDYVEPARNFVIQNAYNDWVLLLDADETVFHVKIILWENSCGLLSLTITFVFSKKMLSIGLKKSTQILKSKVKFLEYTKIRI
jgi:glycosyltransferase involved in cell wall biosynthesis